MKIEEVIADGTDERSNLRIMVRDFNTLLSVMSRTMRKIEDLSNIKGIKKEELTTLKANKRRIKDWRGDKIEKKHIRNINKICFWKTSIKLMNVQIC